MLKNRLMIRRPSSCHAGMDGRMPVVPILSFSFDVILSLVLLQGWVLIFVLIRVSDVSVKPMAYPNLRL